jgi:hypothetical protein
MDTLVMASFPDLVMWVARPVTLAFVEGRGELVSLLVEE